MTLMMIALLAAVVVTTAVVLADSGLRMWSALGDVARGKALLHEAATLPLQNRPAAARVSTRVSYARAVAVPQRAAA